MSESFTPLRGAQALHDFVADVQPDETGGECSLMRSAGNGALTAIAFYPTRAGSKMQVNVSFDSAGHVIRYGETRGVVHFGPGLKPEQLDSARRAAEALQRTTSINFDYPLDQAIAMNRGKGLPSNAVIGSVREMENLEQLGRPAARMERMRKLCGV